MRDEEFRKHFIEAHNQVPEEQRKALSAAIERAEVAEREVAALREELAAERAKPVTYWSRWQSNPEVTRELHEARALLARFAGAIVAAKNEQGRGFLEETGCPWCPGDEYGTPHDADCPVTIAQAFLAPRSDEGPRCTCGAAGIEAHTLGCPARDEGPRCICTPATDASGQREYHSRECLLQRYPAR